MFLRTFIVSILFLGFVAIPSAFAYKNEGVQRVNPYSAMKRADKEGFETPSDERVIKNDLVRLKKSNPKEFDKKLSQGIENSSQYQGYLMEIKEGLQKVENAKKIAKYHLYTKVESDWNIIKTTALNTRVDKTFSSFKSKLKGDLNEMYYIKFDNGYVFQVAQWGFVTISKNLKNIIWKIEFSSKYDNNKLEEGAEKIKIQEDTQPSGPAGDEGTPDQAPQDQGEL
jgi:hypothetical protein